MKIRFMKDGGTVLVTANPGSVVILFEPEERKLAAEALTSLVNDEEQENLAPLIDEMMRESTIQ